MYIFIICES